MSSQGCILSGGPRGNLFELVLTRKLSDLDVLVDMALEFLLGLSTAYIKAFLLKRAEK